MKKRTAKKKEDKPAKQPVQKPPEEEKDDPFDFGGMPKRDLKKNLGCG